MTYFYLLLKCFVLHLFIVFDRRYYKDHYKVKYTHVQALRLCTGRTAHRGSRGIALLFHDHGTKRG